MKKCFKERLRAFVVIGAQSVFLTGVAVLGVFPTGCTVEIEKPEVIIGDLKPPVIEKIKVSDEKTIEIEFSESVKVDSESVTKVAKGDSQTNEETEDSGRDDEDDSEDETNGSDVEISYNEDNTKVVITLPEPTIPGDDYILSGIVEDERGNTLSFAIPFVGYNGNLPKIIMTEIQTESLSQNSTEKKNGTYRNEFVEFLALSDGNLTGLELVSVNDGEEKKFVFPKVDVKAGEIFVVHMRTRGEGCLSEVGDDLSLAFGGYSKDGIRDFWTTSETTALGNVTDILLVRNSADGSIWDAVMFRSEKISEWPEKFLQPADALMKIGYYEKSDISAATVTEGMTASKTLSRKNAASLRRDVLAGNEISYPIGVTADSWEVTTVSCGEILD